MKMWAIVFFVLPLLGATYISWRMWQMLPFPVWAKGLSMAVLWGSLGVMIANFVIGLDTIPLALARIMYEVGNSWLFIMLYLLMIFLVLDLGRLVHLVPDSFMRNSWSGTITVLAIMLAVFVYGNVHYYQKVRVPLTLQGKGKITKPRRLVLLSDLHLGYHNPRKELARWVDMVNAEQPDLVLIAGDIIDISVRPLSEENMALEFRRLKAPVYACLGNHEYYSGEPKAQQFYKDAGIRLLRDDVAVIGDLCIVGRDDRTNVGRHSLKDIVSNMTAGKYTILLDHQPYHLEEAEQSGIDFQFSGHTHYGQVWPVSWITDLIYEDAYGSHRRGQTDYYVTSGIGIWGGKFRIGTQSEYVVADIQ